MQRGTVTNTLFSLFRQVVSSSSLARHFLTEVAIDKTLEMLGNLSGNLDNGVCHQVSEKHLSVESPHAKSLLYNDKAMRGLIIHSSISHLLLGTHIRVFSTLIRDEIQQSLPFLPALNFGRSVKALPCAGG